jgi:invasion protein IalB
MKSSLAGTILGLALLAALFAASMFLPHGRTADAVAAAPSVSFTGSQRIGDWTLVCTPAAQQSAKPQAPIPFSLTGRPPARQVQDQALGRCRTSLFLANKTNPQQILFAANFRLIWQTHALTLILRFPPSGQKGPIALIRAGDKGIRIPVLTCTADVCTAAGRLDASAEALLYQNKNAVFVFPPGGDKDKQVVLPMPLAGLQQAIAKMRQVED